MWPLGSGKVAGCQKVRPSATCGPGLAGAHGRLAGTPMADGHSLPQEALGHRKVSRGIKVWGLGFKV